MKIKIEAFCHSYTQRTPNKCDDIIFVLNILTNTVIFKNKVIQIEYNFMFDFNIGISQREVWGLNPGFQYELKNIICIYINVQT